MKCKYQPRSEANALLTSVRGGGTGRRQSPAEQNRYNRRTFSHQRNDIARSGPSRGTTQNLTRTEEESR